MEKEICPYIDTKELERVLKVLGNGTIPGEAICISRGGKKKIYGGAAFIGLLWLLGIISLADPETGGSMLGAMAYGGCKIFKALGSVTHNPSIKILDEPGIPNLGNGQCEAMAFFVQQLASRALNVVENVNELVRFGQMLKPTSSKNETTANQNTVKEVIDEVMQKVPPSDSFTDLHQSNRTNDQTKNSPPQPSPPSEDLSHNWLASPPPPPPPKPSSLSFYNYFLRQRNSPPPSPPQKPSSLSFYNYFLRQRNSPPPSEDSSHNWLASPPPPPPPPPSYPLGLEHRSRDSAVAVIQPENNKLGPTPGNVFPIGYLDAILFALSAALLRRRIISKPLITKSKIKENRNPNFRSAFSSLNSTRKRFNLPNEKPISPKLRTALTAKNYRFNYNYVPLHGEIPAAIPSINLSYKDPVRNEEEQRDAMLNNALNEYNKRYKEEVEEKYPEARISNQNGGRTKTHKRRMTKRKQTKRHIRSKRV